MKLIGKILGISIFIVLLTFGLAVTLEIPFLVDPQYLMEQDTVWTALLASGLLALDILLPVPSSIIMITCGHLFGVTIGALVSFSGMMISCVLGYYLGRLSGKLWLNENSSGYQRAQEILGKWGDFALIISRAIPVLSESVIILAGAEKMPFHRVLLASATGLAPTCILYAIVGHYATSLAANVWSFVAVVALALLFLLFRKRLAGTKTLTA
ncbi:MAG TPA: hypothetical protein DCG19_02355 [Cryomorphaceae bacterium]|nr:hypothetical protein [Owenweeksia sp.]HAD96215.1 hypothetical protein [Cryomorphaceae bacterium]HBF18947.1 hypothetical protein [Cryomorphaceae bacterium]|tara:strand:- start:3216 stop:3851 length:636 start_codon:yes stop_codon:yes gene_type:complete